MLRCGFFETDITPNIGNNIPGYYDPRFAETILDPLYAHAFAAEANGTTIVMISMDILLIRKSDADRIRHGLSEKIGVPVGNISVCGTHTHTAGPVIEVDTYPADENYCSFLVSRAIDAGIMAVQHLTEAKIGAASCNVEGISFNRRFRLKNGIVKMNPGFLNPDIVESVDIIDPELTVVRVDFLNGTPMGMIANYALHLDTVGADVYCADYPGVMRRLLRRKYGDSFGFNFLTGACGNINHFDVTKSRDEQLEYSAIGDILFEAASDLFASIETKDVDSVACTSSTFIGHQCRPTEEQCRLFAGNPNEKRMRMIMDKPCEDVPVEIWTARIGNLAIQMLPGEIFTRFGLKLKENSADCDHTLIATLSNQSIGYIYTKEAQLQGGYEATPSSYVEMDAETGYQIVDAGIRNLNTLSNQ